MIKHTLLFAIKHYYSYCFYCILCFGIFLVLPAFAMHQPVQSLMLLSFWHIFKLSCCNISVCKPIDNLYFAYNNLPKIPFYDCHLAYFTEFNINMVDRSAKNGKNVRRASTIVIHVLGKFWKIYSPRFSKNFCRFALNEQNQ